jgi:hypothetical protein
MKTKRLIPAVALALVVVSLSAVAVFALSDAAVDWWVVASGGAPSSAGGITMNCTLGQPVVGQSAGGDVALSAGFWSAGGVYSTYLPLVMSNGSP